MRKNLISILLVILIIAVMVAIGLLIKINNNLEKNSITSSELSLSNNEINSEVEKTDIEHTDTLDNDEAKRLAGDSIKKYSNICGFEDGDIKGMPVILEKLGFTTRDEIQKIFDSSEPVNDYYKTNVKYDVFKEMMLDMMTEEYFNNHFSGYINMDGYVGVVIYGIGMEPIGFDSIETIECIENNKYKCKAKMKDIALFDYGYKEEELSDDELYFYWDVELEKVNNKLLISNFVLEN